MNHADLLLRLELTDTEQAEELQDLLDAVERARDAVNSGREPHAAARLAVAESELQAFIGDLEL